MNNYLKHEPVFFKKTVDKPLTFYPQFASPLSMFSLPKQHIKIQAMKKTNHSKRIDALIFDNQNLSTKELQNLIKKEAGVSLSESGVRARKSRVLNPTQPNTKETTVKDDVVHFVFKKELGDHKKKYKELIAENLRLQQGLEASFAIKNGVDVHRIVYKPLTKDTESIAVVLASDWHIEEEIKSEWVNGLNSYNLEIAKKCAELFFQNTLKLVEKERAQTTIDTLVVALLGDFITGRLHEENLDTAQLQPIEASIMVENMLISGIQYLLDHSDLRLIIPCHSGNHARISHKVHFSVEKGLSLEYIVYKHIASYFKNNPRVRFILSDSYLSYLDLGGYTICFQHGHGIKYGGAYGGITTAVVKRVRIWEQSQHADLYCFGHHHTQFDGGFFIANGSMIGYGARGLALAYGYEPRMQQFFLVNLKYKRKTGVFPIMFNL